MDRGHRGTRASSSVCTWVSWVDRPIVSEQTSGKGRAVTAAATVKQIATDRSPGGSGMAGSPRVDEALSENLFAPHQLADLSRPHTGVSDTMAVRSLIPTPGRSWRPAGSCDTNLAGGPKIGVSNRPDYEERANVLAGALSSRPGRTDSTSFAVMLNRSGVK